MSRDSSWPRIPLAQPNIGSDEVELVMQVLASDVLSLGPMVEEFEALAENLLRGALHPSLGRGYVACSYRPMVDLLEYLVANGFAI